MSQQIDTALVNAYQSNIEIQFQQMESRLTRTVTVQPQNAEYEYYDRIGAVEAVEDDIRHGDTQYVDTPHSRRRVQTSPAYFSDLIDKRDKLRMLADPTSAYVRNAVMAINRNTDRKIIAAALGTAYTGKAGGTAVTFPSTQEVAVDFEIGGTAAGNLTVDKLSEAMRLLRAAEAIEDGEEVFCILNAEALQSLLDQTEVKSADYNSIKALVQGQVDTFYGMTFVRTELLTLKAGTDDRQILVYPKSAITLGVAENIFTSVDVLPTKKFSTQVFVSHDKGAVRMWEEKVVSILCDEA